MIDFFNEMLPREAASFIARQGGPLGASSGLLTLLLVSFLLAGKTVRGFVPVVYLSVLTAFCFLWRWDLTSSAFSASVLLGSFILVNDNPTLPLAKQGRASAALLAAVITAFLWRHVDYFVAVSFSVLAVNLLTPWLDVWIGPKGTL